MPTITDWLRATNQPETVKPVAPKCDFGCTQIDGVVWDDSTRCLVCGMLLKDLPKD